MMTNEEREILNKIKYDANKIETVEEFRIFCEKLKDNNYHHYNSMKIIIPSIIKNLAKEIDIKNQLNDWEDIIGLLHYHFLKEFMNDALDELYVYFPDYPIECLFELILYNSDSSHEDYHLFWYSSMTQIYKKFYRDKIDNELFDKYILFAYDDTRYFIALLYKIHFNIPKNSIYLNIEKLLKNRFAYYDSMGSGLSDQMLAQHGLLIKDIENININRFSYSYIYEGKYSLLGVTRSGDIGFADREGMVYAVKTTFIKSAVFETNEFKKLKKENSVYDFHNFLIYKWGIVKYFKYIYKYGDYPKYSKLYNKLFMFLEKEAKDINNSIAIENLSKINKIIYFKILETYPDEINEEVLIEGAKKQIIVNAYERNPKARKECIQKYGYDCFICGFNFKKHYGEIGENFIHVHHLKPLSEIQKEYKVNPIEDLRPICPNCHAMLHRKVPAYSIDEIENILKGKIK